jgi:hypothetical protein
MPLRINGSRHAKKTNRQYVSRAVKNAGHGFSENGLGSNNLGHSDVPDKLLR